MANAGAQRKLFDQTCQGKLRASGGVAALPQV